MENTAASNEIVLACLQLCGVNHEHSLENLGQIPQVESVVRLGWCWQQLCTDGVVHVYAHVHQFAALFLQVRSLGCKMYRSADGEGFFGQQGSED